MIDIAIICIYLSFVVDFFVKPIPSEVSTLSMAKNSDFRFSLGFTAMAVCQALILLLWLVPLLIALLNFWFKPGHPFSVYHWIGILLAVAGRVFTLSASNLLSKSGTNNVTTKQVFSISRHPIVTGLHICLAGLLLSSGKPQLWPVYFVPLVYFDYKIRLEEKNLIDKFGSSYINYMSKTPRYLLI